MSTFVAFLVFLALAGIVFVIYFWPTIVANRRQHPQRVAIGVLNTLLGWTFIGWALALVWAYTVQK